MFPKFLEGCGAGKNRGTEGGELEEPGAVGGSREAGGVCLDVGGVCVSSVGVRVCRACVKK